MGNAIRFENINLQFGEIAQIIRDGEKHVRGKDVTNENNPDADLNLAEERHTDENRSNDDTVVIITEETNMSTENSKPIDAGVIEYTVPKEEKENENIKQYDVDTKPNASFPPENNFNETREVVTEMGNFHDREKKSKPVDAEVTEQPAPKEDRKDNKKENDGDMKTATSVPLGKNCEIT